MNVIETALHLFQEFGIVAIISQSWEEKDEFFRELNDAGKKGGFPGWHNELCNSEFERFMHPKVQVRTIQSLKATENSISTQWRILGTNSPYVLDELKAEQVIVLHEGRFAVLSNNPQYEEWKGSMTAGEFWMFVGEEWVKEWK